MHRISAGGTLRIAGAEQRFITHWSVSRTNGWIGLKRLDMVASFNYLWIAPDMLLTALASNPTMHYRVTRATQIDYWRFAIHGRRIDCTR